MPNPASSIPQIGSHYSTIPFYSKGTKVGLSCAAIIFAAGAGFFCIAAFKSNIQLFNHKALGFCLFGVSTGITLLLIGGTIFVVNRKKRVPNEPLQNDNPVVLTPLPAQPAKSVTNHPIDLLRDAIKNHQLKLSDARPGDESIPYHPIFGGLYLGNTRGLSLIVNGSYRCSRGVITETPVDFKHVITVVPLNEPNVMSNGYNGEQPTEEKLRQFFNVKGIGWHNPGAYFTDSPELKEWNSLVASCTSPDYQFCNFKLINDQLCDESGSPIIDNNQLNENIQKMSAKFLEQTPVTEWFEPIFKVIDKAILDNEDVFVHCAAGISRSSSLLIAYLINRCGVTAEEAENFLRYKRNCVNSNFSRFLKEYEKKLLKAQTTQPL